MWFNHLRMISPKLTLPEVAAQKTLSVPVTFLGTQNTA
jgi:hypothetical protein